MNVFHMLRNGKETWCVYLNEPEFKQDNEGFPVITYEVVSLSNLARRFTAYVKERSLTPYFGPWALQIDRYHPTAESSGDA